MVLRRKGQGNRVTEPQRILLTIHGQIGRRSQLRIIEA